MTACQLRIDRRHALADGRGDCRPFNSLGTPPILSCLAYQDAILTSRDVSPSMMGSRLQSRLAPMRLTPSIRTDLMAAGPCGRALQAEVCVWQCDVALLVAMNMLRCPILGQKSIPMPARRYVFLI
jgi:hypothetical protein